MFKDLLLMALLAASEVDAKARYSGGSSSYTRRTTTYTPSSYYSYGGGSHTYVNIGGGYNYGYYNGYSSTTVHTNGDSAVGFFLLVALIIICVVISRCRNALHAVRGEYESYEEPMGTTTVVEETIVVNHGGQQPGMPYMQPPMPGMEAGMPQGPPPAYPPGYAPMQPGMFPPGQMPPPGYQPGMPTQPGFPQPGQAY